MNSTMKEASFSSEFQTRQNLPWLIIKTGLHWRQKQKKETEENFCSGVNQKNLTIKQETKAKPERMES